MNTTTTPTSDDYNQGFRDGIAYAQRLEDESAVLEFIFGSKKREDLSEKQQRIADRMLKK